MNSSIQITLKEFLNLNGSRMNSCPIRYSKYDVYVIQDNNIAFYVGYSNPNGFTDGGAWGRMFGHIRGRFTDHSIVGQFIRCNWPESMNFLISFFIGGRSMERQLIEILTPCFNKAYNPAPTKLPEKYKQPQVIFSYPRSVAVMVREARYEILSKNRNL